MPDNGCCKIASEGSSTKVLFTEQILGNQPELQDAFARIESLIGELSEPDMVFDLGGVTYVASVVVAWFFDFAKKIKTKSGRMRIVNANEPIVQSFVVTRLHKVCEVEGAAS